MGANGKSPRHAQVQNIFLDLNQGQHYTFFSLFVGEIEMEIDICIPGLSDLLEFTPHKRLFKLTTLVVGETNTR